jgi:hypothetical protein
MSQIGVLRRSSGVASFCVVDSSLCTSTMARTSQAARKSTGATAPRHTLNRSNDGISITPTQPTATTTIKPIIPPTQSDATHDLVGLQLVVENGYQLLYSSGALFVLMEAMLCTIAVCVPGPSALTAPSYL